MANRAFHQYNSVDHDAGKGSGTHMTAQFGCNGAFHVIALAEVDYDDQGRVTGARSCGHEQLGMCDATCSRSIGDPKNAGQGFLYDYQGDKGEHD